MLLVVVLPIRRRAVTRSPGYDRGGYKNTFPNEIRKMHIFDDVDSNRIYQATQARHPGSALDTLTVGQLPLDGRLHQMISWELGGVR